MIDIIIYIVLALLVVIIAFVCLVVLLIGMGLKSREDPEILKKWKEKGCTNN